MWKKAFMILLLLNLTIIITPIAWYLSLPRAKSAPSVPALTSSRGANVDVNVSDQALNEILKAAIAQKPEVSKLLSYANVKFDDVWTCDVGIKLDNSTAPFQITFLPTVDNGNLDLQIMDATMNNVTMTNTLDSIIGLLPLPTWVTFQPGTDTLEFNLADLPDGPIQVQAVGYSSQTHSLALQVGDSKY